MLSKEARRKMSREKEENRLETMMMLYRRKANSLEVLSESY